MRLALVALALVACSDRKTPPPAAAVATPSRQGFAIPATTKQLVITVIDDWNATGGELSLWQRGARWQKLDAWPVAIGAHGAAWGLGVHGKIDRAGPIKREGDHRSPAGVFALRSTYGYAAGAPKGWRMPYEPAVDLECINDPGSDHYASIVDRKQVASDWQSAEQMRRPDELYRWVIDIAHNPDHKPSAGSCIFMHVWSGPQTTTEGCTAMDRGKLESLLAKLDPAAQPLFVLLPRADYRALADVWALPAL